MAAPDDMGVGGSSTSTAPTSAPSRGGGGGGGGKQAPSYTTSLLAGAASGLTVDLLFYPIDTLKTRLQSRQGFLASGGFKRIYRGLGSVAVGSAPGAAAFFVAYEALKPGLASTGWLEAGSAASHMAAASIAEVTACLIRVPTEVIKARQQTSSYGAVGSATALRAVLAESGLRGCYRGFGSTISREIPFTCIQFPLYEYLKQRIAVSPLFGHGDDAVAAPLPTWQAGLAGSAAGAVAAGLTTPLDVVKTRVMLERRQAVAVAEMASPALPPTPPPTFPPHPAAAPSAAPSSPSSPWSKNTRAPPTPPPRSPPPSSSSSASAARVGGGGGVNVRTLPTLLHVLRHEGFGALWAGFWPRTAWIGLGGAVFLGVFEAGVGVLEPTLAR